MRLVTEVIANAWMGYAVLLAFGPSKLVGPLLQRWGGYDKDGTK